MRTISVAQAKAQLSEILTEVERGRDVVITRRGQPVARLSRFQRPRKPIDFEELDAMRARQRMATEPSVRLLRKMRDEGY
jgi:antitoxin (DNA-binding transcriptional repressor) of toxin-antitoxin stability system